ncbi:sulfite exporter TauE/SafE family protein [Lacunimicrobium album]
MTWIAILFGGVIGLSLGLTGGGGAIFAVPLLVYGLGTPPREAVGISLAAVGVTSIAGFISRLHKGEVELKTGLFFAVFGMMGAPVGTWLSRLFDDAVLLTMFAGLMLVVAGQLWRKAGSNEVMAESRDRSCKTEEATCARDECGQLILTSPCALLLSIVGGMTGILSGLFGVGGGFVIVPALVLFSGMSMHRAVGTSLMVISLVSLSGIVSLVQSGQQISWELTGLFIAGGLVGLLAGQLIGHRLSEKSLQRTFSIAILIVAVFVISRTMV